MVVSLLKLLTTGVQDERIFKGSSFYPFLKVWIRTCRFGMRWERIDFADPLTFGTTGNAHLSTKGHFITRLLFVATMPDIYKQQKRAADICAAGTTFAGPNFGWTNSLGHALIRSISISISGTVIDTLNGLLFEVLDEYSTPIEKETVVNRLIKRSDNGFTETTFGHTSGGTVVAVPIPFWFARGDPCCAFPIVAMPYDDIVVSMSLQPLSSLYFTDSRATPSQQTGESGSALWPMSGSSFYCKATAPAGIEIKELNPLDPTAKYELIPDVNMPTENELQLGEHYFMAEYAYVDSTEANKMCTSQIDIPIVQHYSMPRYETRGTPKASIPLHIPNPTRDIYWVIQRTDAHLYNAHFLATRELGHPDPSNPVPWWPDALGLSATSPAFLRPAFALSDSEPIKGMALIYEGSLVRFRTEAPALYRSIFSSFEQKKSPWINRYYYNYSFAIHNRTTPFSHPIGEANLDRIHNIQLELEFQPKRGSYNPNDVPKYHVFVFAETYNILKIYGGRATTLFRY